MELNLKVRQDPHRRKNGGREIGITPHRRAKRRKDLRRLDSEQCPNDPNRQKSTERPTADENIPDENGQGECDVQGRGGERDIGKGEGN